MHVFHTSAELVTWRQSVSHQPLHFVPTMGALHYGHQSLLKCAGQQRGYGPPLVLASVFVNPLQFRAGEDFDRYPRTLNQDIALAAASGANALFLPDEKSLYPNGSDQVTKIQVPKTLQQHLCGSHRLGQIYLILV